MLDGAFRRERGGSDITALGKRGVRAVGAGGGREALVRAMRWICVFLPPDIDVRHLLSCHESIVL